MDHWLNASDGLHCAAVIEYETKRWAHVVFRVHGSVLPRIMGRTLLFSGVGALIAYLHFERGIDLSIPGTAHAMVGVALGLLLVFRTNASYDRYWEGRQLLGAMVNNCRDLVRQASSLMTQSSAHARGDVHRYTIALYATIRRYLRRECEYPELSECLSPGEIEEISASAAAPLLVARWISDCLVAEADAGRLSEVRLRHIDTTISDLVDEWGGTERILNTPVPFAYAHHIKSFLTLFCLTAPFALLGTVAWFTPVATAVVSYGLFGIDEIGVEIEDPFGYDANDLPLDEIGRSINSCVVDAMEFDQAERKENVL